MGLVIFAVCTFLLFPGSLVQAGSERIETTSEGIVLTLEFPSPELREVRREGETFTKISLPGCGYIRSVGKPLLPVLRRLIEIPQGTEPGLETEILLKEELRISSPILPAQLPVTKSSITQSQFFFDRQFYTTSSWFPEEVSRIEKVGVMRKRRIALIRVCPVRYLPDEGKIAVIHRLKILIKFGEAKSGAPSEEVTHYSSLPFERLMRARVDNFRYSGELNSEIEYLIIVGDDFADQLTPFVQWKRSKGFHTTLVKLSDISPRPTTEEIKAWIENAYKNWKIPPSYVLLVGDVDRLPAWTGEHSGLPTDLYYSTVDGEDIFPDLLLGRLSVETPQQTSAIIGKIVEYEKSDWEIMDEWLEKSYFIASTDPHFHLVAESTHTYCMRIARENGMICDSLWGFYDSGTPIDIAFNEGRSIVVYSGHGYRGGWLGPQFTIPDVEALKNVDKYPLVLSHACWTGDYSSNCLGEALIRGTDYGAVAFLGSSGPTFWDEDDIFQRSIFDALFSDSLTALSAFTEYAKSTLLNMDDSLYAYYYYEVYNLLGDPSLDIYTDFPHPIQVIHPDTIPAGLYALEVEVQDSGEPVQHALVSCTTDTVWTAYTDTLGIARIELETSSGDTVWLTVTGHNLRPYQSYILVSSEKIPPRISDQFRLFQNRPNPFQENTDIEYYIDRGGEITLEIYDSVGRILVHHTERIDPGYHTFRWNGKDSRGGCVSSGIYFYRLKMSEKYPTKKMVMVK